ncbi:rhamnulose-1-phosphate aldolase [Alkaliphilus crotonatoxidans]
MKKEVLQSNFILEMVKVIYDMWLKGWDERNGGNVSVRLKKEDIEKYLEPKDEEVEEEQLLIEVPELAGEYFLITGSGKYFRNVILDPKENLGVIKINEKGDAYKLLWGYSKGGRPTSEFPAHLLSHAERVKLTKGKDRVIIHTHATNLIALTYVLELDEAKFTKALWQMSTECLVVFPDGVGLLPWMVPGSEEIGIATSHKMRKHSMVIWPYHGIFGAGPDLDYTFGLIDTAEKSAEILVKVLSMGGPKQKISDYELKQLAQAFDVKIMDIL